MERLQKTEHWSVRESTDGATRYFCRFKTKREAEKFLREANRRFPNGQSTLVVVRCDC